MCYPPFSNEIVSIAGNKKELSIIKKTDVIKTKKDDFRKYIKLLIREY